MVKDYIQLAIWTVLGFVITWGDFLAWYGFRGSNKRGTKVAEVFTLIIGIAWIILWVSAVVWNLIEILGGDPSLSPRPNPTSSTSQL